MTRARLPRPHEVAAAQRDPRLLRAITERDVDPGWRTRGVCRTVDPETFFPAPSEPADAAVALCRTCVVQGPCLAWALEVGDCHGVWGATTPRERRAMLVAWRAGQLGQPVPMRLGRPVDGLMEMCPMEAQIGMRSTEPMIPVRPPASTVLTGGTAGDSCPAASLVAAQPEQSEPAPLGRGRAVLAGHFEVELADELAGLDELVEQVPV